jgi:DNA-directed RNA polymerase specialized sigma24 family protein
VDEMPLAELGRLLGLNHSTLTMRLHRIRERLKACLEGRGGAGAQTS